MNDSIKVRLKTLDECLESHLQSNIEPTAYLIGFRFVNSI